MSYSDFIDAELVVVMDVIAGYKERIEMQMRMSWEQTRWLAAIGLQPHLSKGKSLKLQDLIKFDWEADLKPTKRVLTEEQLEYRRRMDEFMRKQHGLA